MPEILIVLGLVLAVPIMRLLVECVADFAWVHWNHARRRAVADYPYLSERTAIERNGIVAAMAVSTWLIFAAWITLPLALVETVRLTVPLYLWLAGHVSLLLAHVCLRLWWHLWRHSNGSAGDDHVSPGYAAGYAAGRAVRRWLRGHGVPVIGHGRRMVTAMPASVTAPPASVPGPGSSAKQR